MRLVRALYLALMQTIIFGRGFAWVLHVRRALLLENYTNESKHIEFWCWSMGRMVELYF